VTPSSESTRVLRAFAYLRAMSLANALRHRLRRLKQPKYLFGAAVMAGYVGLFFVVPMLMAKPGTLSSSPDLLYFLSGLASLLAAVAVATAWLVPGDRAALAFSEAEVAFLFPAPLTRVALINFSLLRSQVTIFVSAFLLSILFGRGRGLPGNAWQHATALWLVMATLRLHFLGASFMHERWFEAGWRPWLRRLVGAVVLLVVVGGLVGWIAAHVRPPTADDVASGEALGRWLRPVLDAPPAATVLAPFRWLVAPLFAGGSGGWGWSLLPAFALLSLHYLWVVRAHVAFEEASIDRARRSAARAQALRDGRSLFRTGAATKQHAPFALAPRGFAPVAFLWEGLIALGPSVRPRNVLVLLAVVAAVVFGLAQTPWRVAVGVVGAMAFGLAVSAPLFGPMLTQGSLRETLDRLDILKALPLPGWQIALGQLLAPVLLIAVAQWALLSTLAMTMLATGKPIGATFLVGVLCGVLLTPPLAMLTLCVPFGGLLWFPAWAGAISARGGGFEVAGQRMVYGIVFMLVLSCALLPAGVVGGGAWLLGGLFDWPLTGMLLGGVAATGVLVAETWLVLRGLGHRIEHFDLSLESR
jgi:hypothetical protein